MRGNPKNSGFSSLSLLLSLVALGFMANIFLLIPLPYPTWCAACIAATAYRVCRIARA